MNVEADTDTESEPAAINPRRVLWSTGVAAVMLSALAAGVGRFFREPLQRISEQFVSALGGPGIALGYAVPDALTVPIPNDIFGWFGLEGGLAFWVVVMWGTIGSLIGGSVGYLIGKKLRRTRWVDRFLTGRGRGVEALVHRYGVHAVAIAAVTPLPYSLSAWAAGAASVGYGRFVLVSLLRVFRVAGALYLIRLGLWSTGG